MRKAQEAIKSEPGESGDFLPMQSPSELRLPSRRACVESRRGEEDGRGKEWALGHVAMKEREVLLVSSSGPRRAECLCVCDVLPRKDAETVKSTYPASIT